MRKFFLLISPFLIDCAGPVVTSCSHSKLFPFSSERPVETFHVARPGTATNPWFADGGPTVLTAHNPTSSFMQVSIRCEDASTRWQVCLPPRTEKKGFAEFMYRDAQTEICEVDEYLVSDSTSCVGE